MKGQLTLEMLVVGALALALLLIAASAVSKIQYAEAMMFERKILQEELHYMAEYADEICILGAGNARTVPLSNTPLNIDASENKKMLIVKLGEWHAVEETACEIKIIENVPFQNTAYLWYEENEDKVILSSEPKT
ncbi:MAG: hypothetical protein ABIH83_01200 [Candidatus Micrarchaeota archaeon]